jgi:glycosyltransferase involved in cell wall biosynthesis
MQMILNKAGEVTRRAPRDEGSGTETGRPNRTTSGQDNPAVALLTAGCDKPYTIGLADALGERGLAFDVVVGDDVTPELLKHPQRVSLFNFRGDCSEKASTFEKVTRVLSYYVRLVRYAATSKAPVFHILWNMHRFEALDRTILMLYYRALGKKVVMTAHNVNAAARDGIDSALNRLTLRIQYQLCHHIFLHTEKMREQLIVEFGVRPERASVIPFGINATTPRTNITPSDAKRTLGVSADQKTLLFFGNIAPYKGLHLLVEAVAQINGGGAEYRLVIAGRTKQSEAYWQAIKEYIATHGIGDAVVERICFIPDEDVEIYFKAADVLVLPYLSIYQSGVLFLAYDFGLPVIATDVGSFAAHVIEGETGWICRPNDPIDLARALRAHFDSPLYRELQARRAGVARFAHERYSWQRVADLTSDVYRAVV